MLRRERRRDLDLSHRVAFDPVFHGASFLGSVDSRLGRRRGSSTGRKASFAWRCASIQTADGPHRTDPCHQVRHADPSAPELVSSTPSSADRCTTSGPVTIAKEARSTAAYHDVAFHPFHRLGDASAPPQHRPTPADARDGSRARTNARSSPGLHDEPEHADVGRAGPRRTVAESGGSRRGGSDPTGVRTPPRHTARLGSRIRSDGVR